MYLQLIKALGGNPIVIPPTEVYSALERNVVDGYCWVTVGIRDWGWQKVTKYIVDVPFYRGPNPLLVNLNTWNKLPKKFQALLTDAAKEAEKKAVARFEELTKEERPILLKEGIKEIELPPAEKQKFLKVAYEERISGLGSGIRRPGPEGGSSATDTIRRQAEVGRRQQYDDGRTSTNGLRSTTQEEQEKAGFFARLKNQRWEERYETVIVIG